MKELAKFFSIRNVYFLLFALCLLIFCIAIYLQVVHSLQPCPLCIIQRIFFIVIGFVSLIAALHNPYSRLVQQIYGYVILVLAVLGLAIASRQLWIQYAPGDQIHACGADLIYLLQNLPLHESIKLIFKGTGECQHVGPRIFLLTIVEWSFVFFVILIAIASVQIIRARKPRWK